MMPKATSCFSSVPQGLQILPSVTEYLVSPSLEINSSDSASQSSSLLFYLSVLKDKLNQLQNLVGVNVIVSPEHITPNSMAISSMNSTINEIIIAANSMKLTCQEMMMMPLDSTTPGITTTTCTDQQLHQQHSNHDHRLPPNQSNFGNNNSNMFPDIKRHSLFSTTEAEAEAENWFAETYNNNNNSNSNETDIIELDAGDLLARYTHFCQVCCKGFKRDANLRMHMRAHGDEYKTTAALSNPMKNKGSSGCNFMSMKPKKYSCPQEGCRWNQKHARFQPMKSMICVKNHYKRSHCPKMYVCKRCNQKQFSLLSDLRTHEKHCGDPRWQCSCGTTFSRKDKLMGHVALFVGHTPLSYSGKLGQQGIAAEDRW